MVTDACAEMMAIALERGPAWFPEIAENEATVDVRDVRETRDVTLVRFTLSGRSTSHGLVAKQYALLPVEGYYQRPRLGRVDDQAARPEVEYRALRAMWGVFGDSEDGAHAAVRPIDVDVDRRVLVMAEFPGSDARLLNGAKEPQAACAFHAAGASLARAHRLDTADATLRSTVEEIDAAYEAALTYVTDRVGWPTRRADRMRGWWLDRPVDPPALGTAHMDCAPRNLLVAPGPRVAWIDGLFRTRSPIYEDVATFTLSLRLGRWSGRSVGASRRRRCDEHARSFVEGYRSCATLDDAWMRRFEVLVLLDRIASIASRRQPPLTRVFRKLCERELARLVAVTST